MKKTPLIAISLVLAAGVAWPSQAPRAAVVQKERTQMPEYEGKVNAPEFPDGMEWLNTERPLSIRQLKGKLVLLDFWTYCCINCMHIIPDLKKLEHKYANELVVIGVHSAKFPAERGTENIRQAILRYEIEHPVVNDHEMQIWQSYTANSWPTLFLIDPAGKVVAYMSGEGVYAQLDGIIAKVIATFDAKKMIDRRPLNLKLERQRTPTSLLAFPGKILADEKSKQLFISDSNHNRIVVVSLDDSSVKEVIGSGEIGLKDGSFETAAFNHPQGVALDGNVLYVADTENHAIRAIDLARRTVATIAGTGEQLQHRVTFGGQGKDIALSSPWDLTMQSGILYIAMAGPHQLWQMNPKTGGIAPYAGSGREARIDGRLAEAALAQPSGITSDGKKLYFADSEVSSIRSADLDPNGRVDTIVGEDLFEFGDRDGKGAVVRLQHPLGVVYSDGWLYVADTYNNKIKRVSAKERTSETFVGTGENGMQDGDRATLNEPSGVSVAFGRLYVADTNNHLIRVVDLKTRRTETLQIKGLDKLRPRKAKQFAGETIELPAQSIEPGDATLELQLVLPAGYKLNAEAPSALTVAASPGQAVNITGGAERVFSNPRFPVRVPIKVSEGEAVLRADFVVYYCEAVKESLCFFKEARVSIPVKVVKGSGNHRLSGTYKLRISD
jgi:DNA-binding beta-propeller fold protein YncE